MKLIKRKLYFIIITIVLSITIIGGCSNSEATENRDGQILDTQLNEDTNAQEDIEKEKQNHSDTVTIKTKQDKKAVTVATLEDGLFEKEELDSTWDSKNITRINLDKDKILAYGEGVSVKENIATITSSGSYLISGTLLEGQIVINAKNKKAIHLILSEADIYYSKSAPIYIKNAEKTIISLAEGTKNYISDGESYSLSISDDGKTNAALYSNSDLVINGKGSLEVTGNYNIGIHSRKNLKITESSILVTSVAEGMVGEDSVTTYNANISINSGGDGIRTNNKTNEEGTIRLMGGDYNIASSLDAVQAATSIKTKVGKFYLISGGGSDNSRIDSQDRTNHIVYDKDDNSIKSSDGLKANKNITIDGSVLTINAKDDAIHTKSSISLKDAELAIAAGDDGIHADKKSNMESGSVTITRSQVGLEGKIVTIKDGYLEITAYDDGINIANGNDNQPETIIRSSDTKETKDTSETIGNINSEDSQKGENSIDTQESSDTEENIDASYLKINEGTVYIDAAGDGIDAKGSLYIEGGNVLINGPSDTYNGAISYSGTFQISGGILIAAGYQDKAMAPTDSSPQHSVMMSFDTVQKAGSMVSLVDSDGNDVVTFTTKREFNNIIISSPAIETGKEFVLYRDGSYKAGNQINGYYHNGIYVPGTEIIQFTIKNSVTFLDEKGPIESQESIPN